MSENVHYNISIVVNKVEHKTITSGQYRDQTTVTKRVVTESGKVEIKNTDFDVAKSLAAAHLDLLTEFQGTDPKQGNTR